MTSKSISVSIVFQDIRKVTANVLCQTAIECLTAIEVGQLVTGNWLNNNRYLRRIANYQFYVCGLDDVERGMHKMQCLYSYSYRV